MKSRKRLLRAVTVFMLYAMYCTAAAQKPDSLACNESGSRIEAAELKALPFRGQYQRYFSLFPGVVDQTYKWDWWLHVRGSRHDQIGYRMNGCDIRSAFSGEPLFPVLPEALAFIDMNHSPAAGMSMSPAVFNMQLRQGSTSLEGSLSFESDRFTPAYKQALGTYSYGYTNLTGHISGPVISKNIRLFTAARYEHFDDHYRKFWDGFTYNVDRSGSGEYGDAPAPGEMLDYLGTETIYVRPGNIPEAQSDKYDVQGMLYGMFSPVTITLSGAFSRNQSSQNRQPVLDLFNTMRIPEHITQSSVINLKTEYINSKKFSVRLNLGYVSSSVVQQDPLLKDNFTMYTDSTALAGHGCALRDMQYIPVYCSEFTLPGTNLTNYFKQKESRININLDADYILGCHTIQGGISMMRGSMRSFAVTDHDGLYEYLGQTGIEPEERLHGQESIYLADYVSTYGYDGLGHAINSTTQAFDGPMKPDRYSMYIQDTYKNKHIEISAGLRADRFSTGALVFKDRTIPLDPLQYLPGYQYHGEYYQEPGAFDQAPARVCMQPRLNMKVKAGKNMDLFINWGRYARLPRMADVYTDRYELMSYVFSGWINFFVRGPWARPVETTQAQAGALLNVTPDFCMSLKGYTSHSKNLLQFNYQQLSETSLHTYSTDSYSLLTSTGTSRATGMELAGTYSKKRMYIRGSYTWSRAAGTATYPHSCWYDDWDGTPLLQSRPLEYNQSHRVNILYSCTTGSRVWAAFANIQASLLFQYNNGHSFSIWDGFSGPDPLMDGSLLSDGTQRPRSEKIADITTPAVYTFDAKLEKTFSIGTVTLAAYIYAQNIFNRKNELHVYWRTGSASTDGCLNEYGTDLREYFPEEVFTMYDLINTGHRQHYARVHGGDLYGHPREIRAGIRIAMGKTARRQP